jgi:phosphoadenosine phosphosulfate reductase
MTELPIQLHRGWPVQPYHLPELDMLMGHERAILQWSGGKDSTALLYLSRPWLDRIQVVLADPGALFPHMRGFIRRTCDRLGIDLTVISAMESLDSYHRRLGLPSDIVPFWSSPAGRVLVQDQDRTPLQEPLRCCYARIMAPFVEHIRNSGVTLVLRGSKAADDRVGVPDGFVEDGVEYRSPLWHWSHEQVFAYLRGQGVEPPPHYAAGGQIDSLDCWCCTGHLAYGGAEKLRWMREHEPDLFARLQPRLAQVRAAVAQEVMAFLDVVDGA